MIAGVCPAERTGGSLGSTYTSSHLRFRSPRAGVRSDEVAVHLAARTTTVVVPLLVVTPTELLADAVLLLHEPGAHDGGAGLDDDVLLVEQLVHRQLDERGVRLSGLLHVADGVRPLDHEVDQAVLGIPALQLDRSLVRPEDASNVASHRIPLSTVELPVETAHLGVVEVHAASF